MATPKPENGTVSLTLNELQLQILNAMLQNANLPTAEQKLEVGALQKQVEALAGQA